MLKDYKDLTPEKKRIRMVVVVNLYKAFRERRKKGIKKMSYNDFWEKIARDYNYKNSRCAESAIYRAIRNEQKKTDSSSLKSLQD